MRTTAVRTPEEARKFVAEHLSTFRVMPKNRITKTNEANARKAMRNGFAMIAYRRYREKQWSQGIPARETFQQLMLRKSDGKLFVLVGDTMRDWADRFNADCEKINVNDL